MASDSTSMLVRIFPTSNNLSMDCHKSSIPNNLCSSLHSTLNPSKLRCNNRGNKAGDSQEASISLAVNNPNNPTTQWNLHSFRRDRNRVSSSLRMAPK